MIMNNKKKRIIGNDIRWNLDEKGNFLYNKEEIKEKWMITDTSNPNKTIITKLGLSAVFLHSKETNEIIKGSWKVHFLRNTLTWTVFKELFLQSELGLRCLGTGVTLFTNKQRKTWCELIDNKIVLMVEGRNTKEWGEGIPTRQRIRLIHDELLRREPIRIYLNNTKSFMQFENKNDPVFIPDRITFEKLEILPHE